MSKNEIIKIEGVDSVNILDFEFYVSRNTRLSLLGGSRVSLEQFKLEVFSHICLPNKILVEILGKKYEGCKKSWHLVDYSQTHKNTYSLSLVEVC